MRDSESQRIHDNAVNVLGFMDDKMRSILSRYMELLAAEAAGQCAIVGDELQLRRAQGRAALAHELSEFFKGSRNETVRSKARAIV